MSALADNLWLALAIGLAFGFVLERAGLGSAVKLAGQFYLRDLTVFKVMFTAIVTALIGLAILDAVGLVDSAAIALPDTFLLPQLAGGLIFGIGFIVGGFCPGTGCVGMASGRGDGLAVVLGMLVGMLAFGEVYPLLASFYAATPLGPATLPDVLPLPGPTAAIAVVALAAAGFTAAEWWERRRPA
jgi:uncharacterized membrane protein YedE/YeeE